MRPLLSLLALTLVAAPAAAFDQPASHGCGPYGFGGECQPRIQERVETDCRSGCELTDLAAMEAEEDSLQGPTPRGAFADLTRELLDLAIIQQDREALETGNEEIILRALRLDLGEVRLPEALAEDPSYWVAHVRSEHARLRDLPRGPEVTVNRRNYVGWVRAGAAELTGLSKSWRDLLLDAVIQERSQRRHLGEDARVVRNNRYFGVGFGQLSAQEAARAGVDRYHPGENIRGTAAVLRALVMERALFEDMPINDALIQALDEFCGVGAATRILTRVREGWKLRQRRLREARGRPQTTGRTRPRPSQEPS